MFWFLQRIKSPICGAETAHHTNPPTPTHAFKKHQTFPPPAPTQVVQGLLAVFYNLGDGDYNLTLPHSPLSNGEWHEVELDRFGREFTLRLDGGGGRRQAVGSPGQSQEIIIDPSVVMLGNSFPSGHNRSFLGT